jgi:dihydroorotase
MGFTEIEVIFPRQSDQRLAATVTPDHFFFETDA